MQKGLVTISIPTLNSAAFLERCLEAIKQQTYKHIEITIIDGGSTDNTVAIAKRYHALVKKYPGALLGARYEGVKAAQGEYTLLLDCDQILLPDCIANAVKMMKQFDGLVLEELVYSDKTWLEKLFKFDRQLVHSVSDFSPFTGVMLPRFYKTSILKNAMGEIPENIRETVGGQDHAIIYYEVWQKTHKIGFLKHAVRHIEPDSLKKMWKKFYRWGYTSTSAHYNQYDELLKKKERFRTGLFQKGLILASCASIALLVIKGIPYKIGYYHHKFGI